MQHDPKTIIKLHAEDFLCATNVAALQMLRKYHNGGRNSDHGGESERSMRERLADTIMGLICEIALSRYLNKAWTPGGMYVSVGDVGYKLESRSTEHLGGHLLIYRKDEDQSKFYLLVGAYPNYRVVGWILAKDGKNKDWWRDNSDPPCWWVPQKALHKPDGTI